MKRTLSAASISDDLFDITKYKLDCLQNLIRMINDYKCMKLPSKRRRVNYPDKMYLLPDLLPELNELNDMIGLHKFKKQIVDQIIFFYSIIWGQCYASHSFRGATGYWQNNCI